MEHSFIDELDDENDEMAPWSEYIEDDDDEVLDQMIAEAVTNFEEDWGLPEDLIRDWKNSPFYKTKTLDEYIKLVNDEE